MYWNEEAKQKATAAFGLLLALPEDVWADFQDTKLRIQCSNQAEVRKVRQLFGGGIVWAKSYDAGIGWWTYNAEIAGADVEIYACTEAPPTCRIITEQYTTTEKVATAFEERQVTKTRTRVECGDEA